MLLYISIFLVIALVFIGFIVDDDGGALLSWVLSMIILASLVVFPIHDSYKSYIDMSQTYEATVSQYRSSVKMYEDKAVLELDESSFTDFKYEGYQKQMGSMVKELRNKVTDYNELYIGKKKMSKNFWLGAYIVEPDEDMKLIRLKTGGGMGE